MGNVIVRFRFSNESVGGQGYLSDGSEVLEVAREIRTTPVRSPLGK